jgi:uncharacterized membrane protein YhaH (DUF805 family)
MSVEMYFSHEGRINRKTFWTLVGVRIPTVVVAIVAGIHIDASVGILLGFLIVCNLIVAEIKRWHDINKSGMWVFISLVPFGNFYAIYKLGFCKGTDGANQYGPPTINSQATEGNQS